jgi:hypothetical protein
MERRAIEDRKDFKRPKKSTIIKEVRSMHLDSVEDVVIKSSRRRIAAMSTSIGKGNSSSMQQ